MEDFHVIYQFLIYIYLEESTYEKQTIEVHTTGMVKMVLERIGV